MIRNLAGAVLATIQDYPSIAGGICAFAVAFALVAGNALYSQPGGHPEPLWATRDRLTTRSVAPPRTQLPVHQVRTETIQPTPIPVPSHRPPAPAASAPIADPVRAVQEGLTRLGLYSGEIDGLYGPKTRAAIIAFQKSRALQPDGEVSAGLIAAIAGREAPAADERPAAIAVAATAEDSAALSPSAEPADESTVDVTRAAKVARIQIGLMNFGEPDIAVDGMLGPQTVEAIRAFQRRYDLPVTGEPDDAVIDKLEQIGALKKG